MSPKPQQRQQVPQQNRSSQASRPSLYESASPPARQAQPGQAQPRQAQPRQAQPRQAQQRPTQQRPGQSVQQRPAQQGPRQRANTDEFQRLMRANTVDVSRAPARARRRNPLLGKLALGLAVVSAAVDASAFAVFMGGDAQFAFGICFVVVFLTFVAAVLGFIAAVGSLGRWYGVIGVLLAFAANPIVLIVVLVFVAPDSVADLGS